MTDPTPPAADDPRPGSDPWAPSAPTAPPPGVPAITPVPPGPGAGPWSAGDAPLVGPPTSMLPSGEAVPPYVAGTPVRRPARTVGVALAVVLSLVAGVFGVLEVTAADGAGSPEAAVEALFDALDREDALGVVEALAPDERDLLLPVVRDLGAEADRLALTDGLDLGGVQGVDLRVEGLELEVEELAPGVADVTVVAGTISGSTRLADLPAGSVLEDLLRDEGAEEAERESLVGIRLVARRSDGWHVSALSSIAEEARRSLDPVPPYPAADDAVPARGAESPETAVREAVDAAFALDVRRLIELSPPDEMAVLHEYGEILVAQAEAETGEDALEAELTELELATSDGPDGTKLVEATALHVESTDGDGDLRSYDHRGGCTTITWRTSFDGEEDEVEQQEHCVGDEDEDEMAVLPGFASFYGTEGAESLRVVVVERDGAWYVSPTRTITESLLAGIRALTVEDVQRFVRFTQGDYWVVEPDSFWEACGVERPADDAPDDEAGAAYAACWEALPEDYDGWTYGYDTSWEDEGEAVEDDPAWACYEEAAGDEAVLACLEDLVASGEVEPLALAELRCDAVYEDLYEADDEPTDEEWAAADDRYDACLEAGGEVPEPPSSTPSTSVPATTAPPATTVPATTAPPSTATTAPPATPTTRPNAGS